jgi:hypothetical protein
VLAHTGIGYAEKSTLQLKTVRQEVSRLTVLLVIRADVTTEPIPEVQLDRGHVASIRNAPHDQCDTLLSHVLAGMSSLYVHTTVPNKEWQTVQPLFSELRWSARYELIAQFNSRLYGQLSLRS